jgi:hypothetical protein
MSRLDRLSSPRALLVTAALVALLVVGGVLSLLAHSGPERLGDNGRVGPAVGGFLDPTHHRSCTVLKDVPPGTGAVSVEVVAQNGGGGSTPASTVRRAVTATVRPPGGHQRSVPVTVEPPRLRMRLADDLARNGARLCIRQSKSENYALSIRGVGPDPLAEDAPYGVIYERGTAQSWFDRADGIADHVAASRPAHQGAWTLWFGLALMGAAGAGGLSIAFVALSGRLGHGRRAVASVAAVGVLSAGSWAFLSPPLQTPDSQSHLSYVSYVANHARPAKAGNVDVSTALAAAQRFTREDTVRFLTTARPPFTEQAAGPRPRSDLPDDDGGVVDNARTNPILYYAVAAIPYKISGAGPFGGELLIRLFSALLFGVTVGAVLLALRELLPGTPRLAAIGALLVALLPQAAFISGSVNPDALLFAVSSLLLWRLARAFRRGLSVRDGVILGLLLAIASMSKLAGLMLVPGVVIAVAVLLLRRRRGDDAVSLKALCALGATFVAPFLVYQLLNVAWGQGATGSAQAGGVGSGSLAEQLSYMWQFFLPELPSMTPMFDGSPFHDVYVKQLIGVFGWADTSFDPWVYDVGTAVIIAASVAAVAFVARRWRALRGRVGEFVAYLAILGAFLVLIAHLGYQYRKDLDIKPGGGGFEQVRYLFPLLVFFAAMAVAAIRVFGRRIGPHVALVLVGLAALLSSSAVLTTLARFYA